MTCHDMHDAITQTLATGSEDGIVKVWMLGTRPIDELEPSASLRGHSAPVLCITALPTGELASGGIDGQVQQLQQALLWEHGDDSCYTSVVGI